MAQVHTCVFAPDRANQWLAICEWLEDYECGTLVINDLSKVQELTQSCP